MRLMNLSPITVMIASSANHLSIQKYIRLPSPMRHESRGSIRWCKERRFHHTEEQFIGRLAPQSPRPFNKYMCIQSDHRLPVPFVRIYRKCFKVVALLHSESFLIPNLPFLLGLVTCIHAIRALHLSMAEPDHKNLANICFTFLYTYCGEHK